MKRLALILIFVCLAAPASRGAESVNDLFNQAQKANQEKRFDDALRLYERVIVEHPEAMPDGWFSAQRSIAETLARKGDFAEASKAAHLCLDAAPNFGTFNDVVGFAANILSAEDKKVDRANQFLAFQQTGATGGAGNPMDAVGYPSLPDRERAFATMREQAGDTAEASRLRAFTFLFVGKPKEAFAQFADAFRRSSNVQDFQRAGRELTTVGLRAVHGHGIGIDTAIQYVTFGPNGPDGKAGTSDDIADPFAQLNSGAPAPGDGGLAGLSAEDIAALRKVRETCELYSGDPSVDGFTRMLSFISLHRANSALDNWGAAGQRDWYLRCALEFNDLNEVIPCTLAAARGRDLHFGGVYPLLAEIDARIAKGPKLTNGVEKIREQFKAVTNELTQMVPNIKPPSTKTLNNPATF